MHVKSPSKSPEQQPVSEPYQHHQRQSLDSETFGRSHRAVEDQDLAPLGVSVDAYGVARQPQIEELTEAQILNNPYGSFAITAEHVGKADPTAESEVDNTSQYMGVTFNNLPDEVVKIARQMRGLDEKQFLMLADLTQKQAWKNVYSLIEYHGTNWYLPALRPVEGEEAPWGVGFERHLLWIAVAGNRIELNMLGYLVRAILLVVIWLTLWAAMPHHIVELRGFLFDPILTVLIATIVGGIVSRLLRIPPLVCVLWIAIIWNNIPHVGYFTSGINPYVRKAASTFGLTVILIRAGLYIKFEEVRPIGLLYIGFAFLPAIAELISHSFMAKAMFDYPDYNWAFTHGAVAAAVSPGVVVPAILSMKLDGFGLTRGPGMLMMPAAPTEMVAAIWNINFMTSLTLSTGETPLWLNILLGPIQIIGGIVLGIILGAVHFMSLKVFLAEARKLPHRRYTLDHMNRVAIMQTVLLVLFGTATLFYAKVVNLNGGGAVAVTIMGVTTGALQRRRSEASYFDEQFKYLCQHTADLWDGIAMPVLFSGVGSAIAFSSVFTAEFFPPMLACVVVGLAARIIVALLVTIRQDYDLGERLVMAVGWCGKATVQAAIGRAALDRALEIHGQVTAHHGKAAADRNVFLARRIVNGGIVLIMICALLGALTLNRIGPKVFRKETSGAVGGGH